MLARSKLNNIESKVSETLINGEISHKDFMVIINEEKNYRELKESIRMMNSQRSDAEKINLMEEGKKIGINEIIKCAVCGSKKSKFIKEQQTKGSLSNLGIISPLDKIPLLRDILF